MLRLVLLLGVLNAACSPRFARTIPAVKGPLREQYRMRYVEIAQGTGEARRAGQGLRGALHRLADRRHQI